MERIVKSELGTIEIYNGNKLHKLDGPAVIFFNGDKEYWENGKLIKRELTNGVTSYYKDNKLHRDSLPALITPNGSYYFRNGKPV